MQPNIQLTGGRLAILHLAAPMAEVRMVAPDLSVPERGTTRRIGEIVEPLRRIIAHPDRNRLMAEFCKLHL